MATDHEIKIVKDIRECRILWEKFSPGNVIWDLWEVIFPFYDESLHEPYFIVIINKEGKEQGVLPLWMEKENKQYRFFGGGFPENRTFWFEGSLFSLVFDNIPPNTRIYEINKKIESLPDPEFKQHFSKEEFHYFLNLERLGYSFDGYLKTFNGKHRESFRRDIRKLENLHYTLSWEKTEHFDDLIIFNTARFGQDSDLADHRYAGSLFSFLSFLEKENMLYTLRVAINGKTEGVQFAAFYNGVYYLLHMGYNKEIKNLGKLLIAEQIKKAMELKAAEVDFLSGDTGWKELWNLEKEPYYTFVK